MVSRKGRRMEDLMWMKGKLARGENMEFLVEKEGEKFLYKGEI